MGSNLDGRSMKNGGRALIVVHGRQNRRNSLAAVLSMVSRHSMLRHGSQIPSQILDQPNDTTTNMQTQMHIQQTQAPNPGDMPLRMVIDQRFAAAIIGVGGSNIRQLAYGSGAHNINIGEMKNERERVIHILGTGKCCSSACLSILEFVHWAYENSPGTSTLKKCKTNGEFELKLLVPNNMIRRLIGARGTCIRKIISESNCSIFIQNSISGRPDTDKERVVTIWGSMESVVKAEKLISNNLRKWWEDDLKNAGLLHETQHSIHSEDTSQNCGQSESNAITPNSGSQCGHPDPEPQAIAIQEPDQACGRPITVEIMEDECMEQDCMQQPYQDCYPMMEIHASDGLHGPVQVIESSYAHDFTVMELQPTVNPKSDSSGPLWVTRGRYNWDDLMNKLQQPQPNPMVVLQGPQPGHGNTPPLVIMQQPHPMSGMPIPIPPPGQMPFPYQAQQYYPYPPPPPNILEGPILPHPHPGPPWMPVGPMPYPYPGQLYHPGFVQVPDPSMDQAICYPQVSMGPVQYPYPDGHIQSHPYHGQMVPMMPYPYFAPQNPMQQIHPIGDPFYTIPLEYPTFNGNIQGEMTTIPEDHDSHYSTYACMNGDPQEVPAIMQQPDSDVTSSSSLEMVQVNGEQEDQAPEHSGIAPHVE